MNNFKGGLQSHAGADAKNSFAVCITVLKHQNMFFTIGTILEPGFWRTIFAQ
jgi:hypothetical protein